MGHPLARDHAAPEVEEREHRVLERDMQTECDPAGGVDLDRNVRPADRLWAARLGGLDALVNIIFHSAGQILSTEVVQGSTGSGTGGGGGAGSSSSG